MWKSKTYRPGFLLLFVNADSIGNSQLVIAADDVWTRHNYHITELRRKEKMEQKFQYLMQRLSQLGYRPHEISNIVKSSIGGKAELVGQLERYEQLGIDYLQNYSQ